MLPKWDEDFKEFREQSVTNALPESPPRMLGIISQKYRPYTKRIPSSWLGFQSDEKKKQGIARSFKEWIDKIQKASKDVLAKNLSKKNMVIDERSFKKHITDESPYNLISIGDFNSLVALSQKHSKPVFELTDDELNFQGKVLDTMKDNQKQFKDSFDRLAVRVCKLIEDDYATSKQFRFSK